MPPPKEIVIFAPANLVLDGDLDAEFESDMDMDMDMDDENDSPDLLYLNDRFLNLASPVPRLRSCFRESLSSARDSAPSIPCRSGHERGDDSKTRERRCRREPSFGSAKSTALISSSMESLRAMSPPSPPPLSCSTRDTSPRIPCRRDVPVADAVTLSPTLVSAGSMSSATASKHEDTPPTIPKRFGSQPDKDADDSDKLTHRFDAPVGTAQPSGLDIDAVFSSVRLCEEHLRSTAFPMQTSRSWGVLGDAIDGRRRRNATHSRRSLSSVDLRFARLRGSRGVSLLRS